MVPQPLFKQLQLRRNRAGWRDWLLSSKSQADRWREKDHKQCTTRGRWPNSSFLEWQSNNVCCMKPRPGTKAFLRIPRHAMQFYIICHLCMFLQLKETKLGADNSTSTRNKVEIRNLIQIMHSSLHQRTLLQAETLFEDQGFRLFKRIGAESCIITHFDSP